jgi:putative hemolysin
MLAAYLILLVGCLAVSFLLSGMEAGLLTLSRLRIRRWMRAGNPRAKILHEYLENPETFLWTILVGNTVSNIVLVGLGVSALYTWLAQWPAVFLLSLAGAALLFYAFCELLPKMLFRQFPNRLCLLLATPFRTIHLVLRPLISLLALFSHWLGGKQFTGLAFGNRNELRLLLQETGQSLTGEERAMIGRVLDLASLEVRHIATPLHRTAGVTTNTPVAQLLDLCRQTDFSRLLVWRPDEQPRRLAGWVNVKSILFQAEVNPQQPIADFVKPALYLDHHLRLDEALRQMQRQRQRLAVVCGPDQIETGMISLQDILKTIFGEISL